MSPQSGEETKRKMQYTLCNRADRPLSWKGIIYEQSANGSQIRSTDRIQPLSKIICFQHIQTLSLTQIRNVVVFHIAIISWNRVTSHRGIGVLIHRHDRGYLHIHSRLITVILIHCRLAMAQLTRC